MGYSPWGHKELGTTEAISPHTNHGKGLGTDTSELDASGTSCFRDTWSLLRVQSPGLRPSLQQSESVVVEL